MTDSGFILICVIWWPTSVIPVCGRLRGRIMRLRLAWTNDKTLSQKQFFFQLNLGLLGTKYHHWEQNMWEDRQLGDGVCS